MIERAQKICKRVEAALKPIGWHVALTGSALYGPEPAEDIDLIFYPNNDQEDKVETIEELFAVAGIKSYRRLEMDSYGAREVYLTWLKDGTEVNVWMMIDF